jgi:hypothetical protein
MFAIVSYAGYIYLANSRFRIVEIFDNEEHATKALGVPIINMSAVKRRSSIYELLYHYFDLPSDSRKIMQCVPWIDREHLVRRPVRLLGVFTNNGEFPEISRPSDRVFCVCDSTGKNYFNVFESLLVERHTYPEYKWTEPDPIQINKGGYDVSTRILYYPKLGEFWDSQQLIGYYDKKRNTKEQEKTLTDLLVNKTMRIPNIEEKRYRVYTYRTTEGLLDSR